MRFVPRASVGTKLTITIFFAILFSWIISSGITSYVSYQRLRAMHADMVKRPDLYPFPIPEPRFGIMDFLVGPQPQLGRPNGPGPGYGFRRRFGLMQPPAEPLPPDGGYQPQRFDQPYPRRVVPPGLGQLPGPQRNPNLISILLSRIGVALLLAVVAGKLLSIGFTRRLNDLAKGASAFNDGNLQYRIKEKGDDEFSQVAASMNKMAERVSEQVNRLEDDAKRRRQFIADMAHELRSPVATIHTMAGALQDGVANDPERQSRAVGSMARSSDRLLNLVTDLLELARLDLKELPINRKSVDLCGLIVSAIESHSASADRNGITLLFEKYDGPVTANIDPMRLSQVLDNLLNNAISYAGEGSKVNISLESDKDVRIIVSDNGCGISDAHLPFIFDPFYRVDTARTPDRGHSGLGLRISRGLIEAHGGELLLTSTENIGTTATIVLPREV